MGLKESVFKLLRKSELYTKVDMIYLAVGSFWSMGGQLLAMVVSLALAAIMAHYVPKELYGNYKYLISLSAVIASFSLVGLGTAVTQAVARGYDGELSFGYRLSLKWSFAIIAIATIGSSYYLYNHNYTLGLAVALIGIVTPFLNSASLFSNFLSGKKQFKRLAMTGILRNILPSLIIIAVVLLFTENPLILFAAYLLTTAIQTQYYYRKTLKEYVKNNSVDPETEKYSFHLSVMSIISAFADQIDKVLVFQHLGGTDLAIYSFATAIPLQIRGFLKNIYQLALPRFAEHKKDALMQSMNRKLIIMGGALVVIVVLYIIAAPLIFKLLFPNYLEAVAYSQVFSISLIAYIMIFPAAALAAHKAVQEMYESYAFSSFVKIALTTLPIYFYGLWGVVMGRILYEFFSLYILARAFNKYGKVE